jgi:hypothetical protein
MKADAYTIAVHEAGHAVMLWVRGYPIGELMAGAEGGYCCTGKLRPEDAVLFSLAGFAVESFYGAAGKLIVEGSHADDFDQARMVLASRGPACLRPDETVREALDRYFEWACDLRHEHHDLIEQLGERLEVHGRLSARTVRAVCASMQNEGR